MKMCSGFFNKLFRDFIERNPQSCVADDYRRLVDGSKCLCHRCQTEEVEKRAEKVLVVKQRRSSSKSRESRRRSQERNVAPQQYSDGRRSMFRRPVYNAMNNPYLDNPRATDAATAVRGHEAERHINYPMIPDNYHRGDVKSRNLRGPPNRTVGDIVASAPPATPDDDTGPPQKAKSEDSKGGGRLGRLTRFFTNYLGFKR